MSDEPKVGQIWRDRDWRMKGRLIRIISISPNGKAICQNCNADGRGTTHRLTEIRLDRFKPTSTGFDLVSQ